MKARVLRALGLTGCGLMLGICIGSGAIGWQNNPAVELEARRPVTAAALHRPHSGGPRTAQDSSDETADESGSVESGWVLKAIRRGDPGRREVALTFDDGPHPPFTQRLLDLLKRLDLHVTFFVVGRKVDQAPELLRRMIREGHEVENHTYHHFNLKVAPIELTESEIRLNNDAIRRACGRIPLFFRPSGGQFNSAVEDATQRHHMVMALWTDDPGDYDDRLGSARVEDRLLTHVRPGAIILLHDGMEQTFAMLPDFVARMRHDGYKFLTMSELAQRLEDVHRAHRELR
jgi:peptidoglycan/xylan/chitin deacetylase (PgdA/CDA1 family)